jgi:MYXO-CTERM domain-containing protein
MTRDLLLVLLVTALGLAAAPSVAAACAGPACGAGHLVPAREDPMVPANVPAFRWLGWSDELSASLYRVGDDGVEVEVETKIEEQDIYPVEPLDEGARYRLEASVPCAGETVTTDIRFHAGADGDLTERDPLEPLALGRLWAETPRYDTVPVAADATCYELHEAAVVDVSVEIAGGPATDWWDLLHFETLVDGEPWAPSGTLSRSDVGDPGTGWVPGGSWYGRGVDRLYVRCDGSSGTELEEGLAEGPHTVQMRATLPGTEFVFETDEITVELYCVYGDDYPDECPYYDYDPLWDECYPRDIACPPTYDPTYESECPASYYGLDAEPHDLVVEEPFGCGCATAGAPTGGAPVAALASFLLLAVTLRRRR